MPILIACYDVLLTYTGGGQTAMFEIIELNYNRPQF